MSAKRHRLRWLRLVDGRLVAEEACETAPDVDCAAVANSETEGAERFCLAHRSASLDIEGAMVVDGRIWLGFRSPRAGGLAILARLAPGPLALRFDGFRFFDLGGRAIRALQHIQGNTYAIAGPEADEDSMHELVSLDLDASTHEALVSLPTASEGVLVVPTADEVLVVIDGEEGESGTCRSPAGWARRALPSTRTRETGNR